MSSKDGDGERLRDLRSALESAEKDLRALGYSVERVVTHPGATLAGQRYEEEVEILVLWGFLVLERDGETRVLGPGGRAHVPPGVPFSIQARGETPAYWLHASRTEKPSPRPEGEGETGT
ncbi:MAG: cupin domain-containing protein [Candidatus Eisenbacteria bacterium]|nr:cupin domain-containing protein [Candidatus Eisenbacteria bacterium]